MPNYQPGIPTGSVPLNQDYLNIQGNFTSLNSQFNVDHVPLTSTSGTPPNGYHTALHLVPQTSVTATPGYGNLYVQQTNDGFNNGQQLFYQFVTGSSVTINTPLTLNLAPKVSPNGYTFLPGGILLQWGQTTTSSTGNRNVLFISANINFPNNCFFVTAQPTDGAPGIKSYAVSDISKTGFQFNTTGYGTGGTTANWIAIGN